MDRFYMFSAYRFWILLLILNICALSCATNASYLLENSLNSLEEYDNWYLIYYENELIGYAHESLTINMINGYPVYRKDYNSHLSYIQFGKEYEISQQAIIVADRNFKLIRFEDIQWRNDDRRYRSGVRTSGLTLRYDNGVSEEMIELEMDVYSILATEFIFLCGFKEEGDSTLIKYFSSYQGEVVEEKLVYDGLAQVMVKGKPKIYHRYRAMDTTNKDEVYFYYDTHQVLQVSTIYGDAIQIRTPYEEVQAAFDL
jgi:hypothetical protein